MFYVRPRMEVISPRGSGALLTVLCCYPALGRQSWGLGAPGCLLTEQSVQRGLSWAQGSYQGYQGWVVKHLLAAHIVGGMERPLQELVSLHSLDAESKFRPWVHKVQTWINQVNRRLPIDGGRSGKWQTSSIAFTPHPSDGPSWFKSAALSSPWVVTSGESAVSKDLRVRFSSFAVVLLGVWTCCFF